LHVLQPKYKRYGFYFFGTIGFKKDPLQIVIEYMSEGGFEVPKHRGKKRKCYSGTGKIFQPNIIE